MEHVLGPRFKLSSLNVRSADPDNGWSQPLHADSGAVADEHGYWVCNSVWMLDDFTARKRRDPHGAGLASLGQAARPGARRSRCAASARDAPHRQAGTVVVMNAHMWHGGTANRTAAQRRAMHVYYTRGDKPQQQYQKRSVAKKCRAG